MFGDVRYGIRTLLQAKGWTMVVVLSVALGIGANTALFSALNALLVSKLPVTDPDSLVRLRWSGDWSAGPGVMTNRSDYGYSRDGSGTTFPYVMYQQFVGSNETMSGLLACAPIGDVNVVVHGQAEIASAMIVSGSYYHVLGVDARLGRTLTPEDDHPAGPPVAVISHRFWMTRFGGSPEAIGAVVRVNDVAATIVGVEPSPFTGVQHAASEARDITVPLAMEPLIRPTETLLTVPTAWWLQVVGRLKPGVTPEQAQLSLERVFRHTTGGESRGPHLRVGSASRGIYDPRPNDVQSLAVLTAVVVLALLLVCANVSNLLLSRAAGRQRELAVRLSLGASRGRLVRQLLTESLLLAFAGGALALVVADWGRHLLPGPAATFDWRVFVFAATATTLAGLAFGIAPAVRATRLAVNAALKDTSRTVVGSRTLLTRSLVVVQVAISLVLVMGAGLFLRTVENLRSVDLGFDARNLLMFRVSPGLTRGDDAQILGLYERIQARLEALPGVRGVALSNPAPFSGSTSQTDLYLENETYPSGHRGRHVHYMAISPEFFRVMEMPVLAGRFFTASDGPDAPKVGVINEAAARALFDEAVPIGRRFGTNPGSTTHFEVVGVVRDARYNSLRDAPPPTLYVPFQQGPVHSAFVQVRTAGDPMTLVSSVREGVRQVDAHLPLAGVSTQMEQLEQRFLQEKVFARASLLFGALALLLAGIGLFGLMSHTVSRRTNEIGIRMALGAQRADVQRLVVGESLSAVLVGVLIGIGAGIMAGRLAASVLFGVVPSDPKTSALAIVTVLAAAAVAAYFPVRRATRIDPLEALRYE